METKYKVKVINETYINALSDNEAKQIAEILITRQSTASLLGHDVFTYSEIEKEVNNGRYVEL